VESLERSLPTIQGPEKYAADGEPLTFGITMVSPRYYAVEVATHAQLFSRRYEEDDRTPENFFASWAEEGLRKGTGTTTYTLPQTAWERLRPAGRIYYRLITAAEDSPEWPDYQTTTPDSQAEAAPFVELAGGPAARAEVVPARLMTSADRRRSDEALWRREGPNL